MYICVFLALVCCCCCCGCVSFNTCIRGHAFLNSINDDDAMHVRILKWILSSLTSRQNKLNTILIERSEWAEEGDLPCDDEIRWYIRKGTSSHRELEWNFRSHLQLINVANYRDRHNDYTICTYVHTLFYRSIDRSIHDDDDDDNTVTLLNERDRSRLAERRVCVV